VKGVTVRFELFQMFREMLYGLGVNLFLKWCGSFVVVHNLPQIGLQQLEQFGSWHEQFAAQNPARF
jgi:hypothetical protein